MGVVEQSGAVRPAPATAAFRTALPSSAPSAEPAAVGIDLGSGYLRIWASGRPLVQLPSLSDSLSAPRPLMWRGRVSDAAGLRALLARIRRGYRHPLPDGAVVVACRPVLSTPAEDEALREVLGAAFHPSRLLLTATVRAAAIGAGVAPGPLLVADVGARLTEVALLADGCLAASRRADVGTRDLVAPSAVDGLAETIAQLVASLRREPRLRHVLDSAAQRGLTLVGGGAPAVELAARATGRLPLPVRSARRPRLAAVHGAGLSALAAIRRAARAGA